MWSEFFLDNYLFLKSENLKLSENLAICWVQIYGDINTLGLLVTLSNISKGLVTQFKGKQQHCIHSLYESLVGQREYTTQPKGSFWCYAIDTKGPMLLLIFKNELIFIILCLSFSFKYLVELKVFKSLKNEATWAKISVSLYINWIFRIMKYGQLSCFEFYSCNQQQCPTIDFFSYWTHGCGQKGPMNYDLPILSPKSFLIGSLVFLELSMVLGVHAVLCLAGLNFLKIISLSYKFNKNKFAGKFSH